MEQFIRGQLFWGFYPAVSSAGGPLNGGIPDRYFLHPELYERDRSLFQLYMPIIRDLSSAGWEPITHASATPRAEIERFGSFRRGPVLLTVRGPQGEPLQAEVTLDIAACGLATASWRIDARDLIADQPLDVDLFDDPPRACFSTSLDAGAVGVYELRPDPVPNGDFDGDEDVDLTDLLHFLFCFVGPDETFAPGHSCLAGDLDTDLDVDLADLAAFQRAFGE